MGVQQNRQTNGKESEINRWKRGGGRGKKMAVFGHVQGIKTIHGGVGGQKMAKFCPRSC